MSTKYRIIITVAAAIVAICVVSTFGYILYLNATNPKILSDFFSKDKPNPNPDKHLVNDVIVVDPPYKDPNTTYTFGYASTLADNEPFEYLYEANLENMDGLPQQIMDTTAYHKFKESEYYHDDIEWHTVGTLNYMNADAYYNQDLHYIAEYYGADDCSIIITTDYDRETLAKFF